MTTEQVQLVKLWSSGLEIAGSTPATTVRLLLTRFPHPVYDGKTKPTDDDQTVIQFKLVET